MRLIVAALLCILPSVGWSDDIAAASRVVAAKIFPEGAIVTRQAGVAVPAGTHRIVVADMPRDLHPQDRPEIHLPLRFEARPMTCGEEPRE